MSQKLGEGGFGNVFLAKHRQTGDKFAIKIIKT
jgi:serine/threonine protein kinase